MNTAQQVSYATHLDIKFPALTVVDVPQLVDGLHRSLVQPDALPGQRLGRPSRCPAGRIPLASASRRRRVLLRSRRQVLRRPSGPLGRAVALAGLRGTQGSRSPDPGARACCRADGRDRGDHPDRRLAVSKVASGMSNRLSLEASPYLRQHADNRSTGTRGARKPSRRRATATCRSTCRSDTRPVTGAM